MLRSSQITETTNSDLVNRLEQQLHACRQFPAAISVEATTLDPLAWLHAQPTDVRFAWSERDDEQIIAGAGIAAEVIAEVGEPAESTVRRCREMLAGNESLRFYGGLSFDGSNAWKNFGAGRFILPRFLLSDGSLHLIVMNQEDVANAAMDLRSLQIAVPEFQTSLPAPSNVSHSPTRDRWQSNVDEALTFIRSEVLEKVVLARKTTMNFESSLDPVALTARIASATHDCFVFCFQFGQGNAFVGATPERLFRRTDDQLFSEVIAGTRPRGASSGQDQRLAYELLTSDKDQLEHDIVRKSIRQKLHKLVDHLDVDSHASVLRLAQKQHLCSEVQGTLKPGVDEGALLQRLHPTPAVGGYPTENALPEIARLEPFNRGWYAAPIGWIGSHDAEFVVGIRSAFVEPGKLSLYSGAGIVKGSDPDQEWDEVENKIRDFVEILGD